VTVTEDGVVVVTAAEERTMQALLSPSVCPKVGGLTMADIWSSGEPCDPGVELGLKNTGTPLMIFIGNPGGVPALVGVSPFGDVGLGDPDGFVGCGPSGFDPGEPGV